MPSKNLKKIIEEDKSYLFQNYGDRLPVCFVRGNGSYLFDQDDKKYIDFFSGIAVSNIGYGNTAFNNALKKQIDALIHSSNWYYNSEQNEAARLISENSFPGKTLFVNSGTEANEAAIKLARKYGISNRIQKPIIVSFNNSFHGRTFGSMSATAQKKIHEGFGPIVPGFKYLPFNDTGRLRKELKKNKNITAVIIELIQGEGGINVADKGFVKELFQLCRKNDILTIVDEVQTGAGRTGSIFAYQNYNIVPDIITLAKGIGGGIPVGAIHVKNYLAGFLGRGAHGTTFGGNHLAGTAVTEVMKIISKKKFLENVKKTSAYYFENLNALKDKSPLIKKIKGMGLHIGIELAIPGQGIVNRALEQGLVINCAAETTIRIMPPLNIGLPAVKAGLKIFEKILLEEDTK